jgi:hypothetical protein
MWHCVDLALTDVLEECIASIFRIENPPAGTSVSRWLQTEAPIGNNQLYKNRERRRENYTAPHPRRRYSSVTAVKTSNFT